MSADIVNLRQARKARARAESVRQADENRVRFGRKKADRRREAAELDLAARRLDGAKRPRTDDTGVS